MEDFKKRKDSVLSGVDLSRKGSVDESIVQLVTFINSQPECVTTSSCSGRICIFEQDPTGEVRKQGCTWLYITHDEISIHSVEDAVNKCTKDAVFKFEGFVLHIQCASLPVAQCVLAEAVAAGYRNSGLTISKKARITVGIRGTHSLEVPLTHQGKVLVSPEYITHVVTLANTRMRENNKRIQRFFDGLQKIFLELAKTKLELNPSLIKSHHKKKASLCIACGMATESQGKAATTNNAKDAAFQQQKGLRDRTQGTSHSVNNSLKYQDSGTQDSHTLKLNTTEEEASISDLFSD